MLKTELLDDVVQEYIIDLANMAIRQWLRKWLQIWDA